MIREVAEVVFAAALGIALTVGLVVLPREKPDPDSPAMPPPVEFAVPAVPAPVDDKQPAAETVPPTDDQPQNVSVDALLKKAERINSKLDEVAKDERGKQR